MNAPSLDVASNRPPRKHPVDMPLAWVREWNPVKAKIAHEGAADFTCGPKNQAITASTLQLNELAI